jgi:hypothetical protein
MSKNAKEICSEIVHKALVEHGTSYYTSLQNIPIGLFFELIYSVQKAAIEDALEEKFRVRNPFGPGGE